MSLLGSAMRTLASALVLAVLLGSVERVFAALGSCGQPVTSGDMPTASDALSTLRVAVGLGVCKPCVCDTDASDAVTAADALAILRKAVGLETPLTCAVECDPLCQDGFLDPGERCDDRNGIEGDGCDSDCTLTGCGNGIVTAGEACDDAGESATCDLDCTPAECGDRHTNPLANETCDDGNASNGDGCEASCSRTPACGNGHRDQSEECDDGNTADADGCSSGCMLETCRTIGDQVRCIVCTAGMVPDDTLQTCVCAPGFEQLEGACADIDECATGTARCADPARCVNVPGSHSCAIDCTPEAFKEALESCGAPTGVITFACNDTTILVPTTSARRTSLCDDLVIDGLDRNIAFELDPPCYASPVTPEQCMGTPSEDGSCECPLVDIGEPFLVLRGKRNVVRNLTIRAFSQGIESAGRDNTVEDSTFSRLCRNAFGNIDLGFGNVFRRLTVTDGCNSCSENYGDIYRTQADRRLRGYYNAIFRDVTFSACRQPLRMTAGGRFMVDHVRMDAGSGGFGCNGPRFTSTVEDDLVVDMHHSTITRCRRGVRIGGDAQALLARNTITDSRYRGVLVTSSASARLWENVILRNGGTGTSEPGLGGVAAGRNARVDLGGGLITIDGTAEPGPGNNVLCGNKRPGGLSADVDNQSATAIEALANYWCTLAPESRVNGPVNTDPFLYEVP